MSVVNSILARGEVALLSSGHGDDLVVISGASIGQRFTARLDVEAVIDPDMPLSADPRMKTMLRILPPMPVFSLGDLITDGLTRWKLIKLADNNASSITTDYELEQQIA